MRTQQSRFARLEADRQRDREEALAERAKLEEARKLDRDEMLASRMLDLEAARSQRDQDFQASLAQRELDLAEAQSQRTYDLEETARARRSDLAIANRRHQEFLETQQQQGTLLDNLRTDLSESVKRLGLEHRQDQTDLRRLLQEDNQATLRSLTELIMQSKGSVATPRVLDQSPPPHPTKSSITPPSERGPSRLSTPRAARVYHEDLDDSSVEGMDAPLPSLVSVKQSHLQFPVNFPTSLLLTYSPQGFPTDDLRGYYAGSYVAPAVMAYQQRELAPTTTVITPTTPYSGPVLSNVEPLSIVQFMVEWKAFQCTGNTRPLHHGISPDAAYSISALNQNYQMYTDAGLWALLWERFGPDNPLRLKALLLDVASTLFCLDQHLPLSTDTCRSVRGFAAIVETIVSHLTPKVNYPINSLSKLFLSCLPTSFSTPIREYFNTYETATVGDRLLYKAEPWNLRMTLITLEAFMTYTQKHLSELLSLTPISVQKKLTSSHLTTGSSALVVSSPASSYFSQPTVATAFGITTAVPKKPPTSSPHATVPVSAAAATTLSAQINPPSSYLSRLTADYISRATQWYNANSSNAKVQR
jgi:hypothetical protein